MGNKKSKNTRQALEDADRLEREKLRGQPDPVRDRPLTNRQRQFVQGKAAVDLGLVPAKSNSQIAREAGYATSRARQAAAENVSKSHIRDQIETYKRSRSDKARTFLEKAEVAQEKLMRMMGRIIEKDDLDFQSAGAALKLMNEVRTSEVKIRAMDPEAYESVLTQGQRLEWLEKRVQIGIVALQFALRHPDRAGAHLKRLKAERQEIRAQRAQLSSTQRDPISPRYAGYHRS